MGDKKIESNFKTNRLDSIRGSGLYSDGFDVSNRYDRNKTYEASSYSNFSELLEALSTADSNKDELVKVSEKLYATNRIYQSLIDTYVNAFLWRYVVVPQKLKVDKVLDKTAYHKMAAEMLELADGLSLEVKVPQILKEMYITGSSFFTSTYDTTKNAINLILLP